jgi:hypothetical protein
MLRSPSSSYDPFLSHTSRLVRSANTQAGDIVKLERFDGEETSRIIGAVVLKSLPNGEIEVDFGPADGAPVVRIVMSQDEAFELGSALHGLDDERVILVDD